MAGTQLFKNTARNAHRRRYLTDEDQFSNGMHYTNTPLAEGFAKAIVNFDLKNDGISLVPRGGLHNIINADSLCSIAMGVNDTDYFVHHADSTYVLNYNGDDAALCNYFILCKSVSGEAPELATAKLVLEFKNNYLVADYDTSNQSALLGEMLMKPPTEVMQDLIIANPVSRDGLHASLEGNTYMLIVTANSHELGRLIIKLNQAETAFTWYVERVAPKEI